MQEILILSLSKEINNDVAVGFEFPAESRNFRWRKLI